MSKEEESTLVMTEQNTEQNPMLSMVVEKDSELKSYIVTHVGTKYDKEEVTAEMITEVLAIEFPEFMYAMAEENFLLGYQQGLNDAEKLYHSARSKTEK